MKGISSQKQTLARERNMHIKRLRGVAATALSIPMSPVARTKILEGVDMALASLKADSEGIHRLKMQKKILFGRYFFGDIE